VENGLDGAVRIPKTEYQRLAERWRRLAADATTPQTRNHLLTLAGQREFLAGNVGDVIAKIAQPQTLAGEIENLDLHRKSGEFPVSHEELEDAATTVYEGV
jgi:hypothetical protein